MDNYDLRPITEDEVYSFQRCFGKAFGHDHHDDEAKLERDLYELGRTLAVVHERDGVVGTAVSMRRELGIPGGTVPASHVTLVSVAGTHRRRGLLRRLMTRQLTDLAGTDEPVAVLWPSEPAIYGRYGYGPATYTLEFHADNRELTLPAAPEPYGFLREVELPDALKVLEEVFDAARVDRPGMSGRSPAGWRAVTADLEHGRHGRSELRTIVHEGPDGPDGYAMFRMERASDATGPQAVVHVEEAVATGLDAYRELWRFLFDVDLTRQVHYDYGALDEPLRLLATDPRRLGARLTDGVWLRILDLPVALAARAYPVAVDAVLDVTDELLPGNAGRWHLLVAGDELTCERTDRPADVALSIAELGAAYLGGTSLASLAVAGRVTELREGTLAPLSAAFGWRREPVSIEVF